MKGVLAGQDFRAAGRRAGELDRRFHRLGAGIGKEHLVQIGRFRQQPLRQNARQSRNIHLHEVRQFGVENAFQGGPQGRMIAADAEHAETAQQIEIARPGPVIEILADAAPKADVVADGPQHPDHLLIQEAVMKLETTTFVLFKNSRNVVVFGFEHRSIC